MDLSRLTGDVAAIWIANGIPLALILLRPRKELWLYAAAAAAGNLAMNLLHGDGLPVSLAFMLCNAGEVVAAALLLRRFGAEDILGSLRSVLLFSGSRLRLELRFSGRPRGRRWRPMLPMHRSCRSGRRGGSPTPPVFSWSRRH